MAASNLSSEKLDDIDIDELLSDVVAKHTDTIDELDQVMLDRILADALAAYEDAAPFSSVAAPAEAISLAPELRESIEASQAKLSRSYGREAEIEAERKRALASGDPSLSTDREAIRKRLDMRRSRERHKGVMRTYADLTTAEIRKVRDEAAARCTALLAAVRSREFAKRWPKVRGNEADIAKWFVARELGKALGWKQSHGQVALVRCLMEGVAKGTFTRDTARRKLDLIERLEAGDGPWRGFVA